MEADTLPKLFARNRELYSDKVALREKDLGIWQRTTWDEYWDHVCFFALGFRHLGLKPGDKLSILGDNCREWLYADLATQCSSASKHRHLPHGRVLASPIYSGELRIQLRCGKRPGTGGQDPGVKGQLARAQEDHSGGYEGAPPIQRSYDRQLQRRRSLGQERS